MEASPPPPPTSTESLAARMLLAMGLGVATGRDLDLMPPGSPGLGDEELRRALFERATRERMLPTVAAYADRFNLDLGTAPALASRAARAVAELHYAHLGPIVASLAERNVEVMLLKGGDLDLTLYGRQVSRTMSDLDIMVKTPAIPAVQEVLAESGYVQGAFDPDDLEIRPYDAATKAALEEDLSELVDFLKIVPLPEVAPFRDAIEEYCDEDRLLFAGNEAYCVLAYDVHTNLSVGFDVRESWRNPRSMQLPDGTPIYAQNRSDMLWFLAARVYHEIMLHTRCAMRYFVDVVAILNTLREEIDWDRILVMAHKYKLHPSLYYVFWHVNEILGDVVPREILDACHLMNPAADRTHDWGDFVPKMLDEIRVEPLLAPAQRQRADLIPAPPS